MAKDYVIVKGRVVRMDEAMLKKFGRHFGAARTRPGAKEAPLDILKIPKLDIIPGKIALVKKEDVTPEPVEAVKVESVIVKPVIVKPVEVLPEPVKKPPVRRKK